MALHLFRTAAGAALRTQQPKKGEKEEDKNLEKKILSPLKNKVSLNVGSQPALKPSIWRFISSQAILIRRPRL